MDDTDQPLIAILGAGKARRFGGAKLSAECAGKPLGRWSLDTALRTGLSIVWIGGSTLPTFIAGECEIVVNPEADMGISRSLALAAEAAEARHAPSLLIMLADMPLVTRELLGQLLERGAPSACIYPDGFPGVPALLPAALFARLRELSGDGGARQILRKLTHLGQVMASPELLLDVDTQDDLQTADHILRTSAER